MRVFIFLLALGTGSAFQLTIYHSNDISCKWSGVDANGGSIQDYKKATYGGAIRMKATIETGKIRCSEDKKLFLNLNAGGTFDGSIEFIINGGENAAKTGELIGKFIALLGLDAIAPGPHEFDLGNEGLTAFLNVAGTNMDSTKIYLNYNADCYESEANFNEAKGERPPLDFQNIHPNHIISQMPICVCANFLLDTYQSVVGSDPPLPRIRRSVVRIFELDGIKVPVGIIGYISQDVKHMRDKRLNDIRKNKVVIGNPVKYVRKESERLNSMGVKIIIALGTAKLENEKEIGNLPLITAVISGQKYDSYMYNPKTQPESNPKNKIPSYPSLLPKLIDGGIVGFTPFAQVYPHGKHLGKLQLKFNKDMTLPLNQEQNDFFVLPTFGDDAQNPIVLNGKVNENADGLISYRQNPDNLSEDFVFSKEDDANIKALLHEWETEFQTQVTEKVKMSPAPYLMLEKWLEGGEACRQKECKLGGIIADAHHKWYSTVKGKIAKYTNLFPEPLGVVCSNNIRGHLGNVFTSPTSPKAVYTYDVMEILSARHKIVILRLTQRQLLDMFKWSISQWNDPHPTGRLLQVSHNVRVTFNFSSLEVTKNGSEKVQIPSVKVEVGIGSTYVDIGQDEYQNTYFDIVTTEYLAKGNSKFSMVKEGQTLGKEECPWKVMEAHLNGLNPKDYRHRLQFYK